MDRSRLIPTTSDELVTHSAVVELPGEVSTRVPRPLFSVVERLYVPSRLWFGTSAELLLMSSVPAALFVPLKLVTPDVSRFARETSSPDPSR